MKILNELEGEHICFIIFFICATIFSVYLISDIKEYNLKETETFVNAGCEYTYVVGRAEKVWTNCKCKKE